MTSVVDICNMALAHCRAGSIVSLTENSVMATYCNLFYDVSRDQILEDCAWGFAHKIAPLAELDSNVFQVFNYARCYQYPSDCARINRLMVNYEEVNQNNSDFYNRIHGHADYTAPTIHRPVEYKLFNVDGTRVIAANEPELRIDYQRKVSDPNDFSSSFVLALSHLLASNIAIPIIGTDAGRSVRNDSLNIYSNLIANAMTNELNQEFEESPESEFVTIRS